MKLFRLLPFLTLPLIAQQTIPLAPPVSSPAVDPNKVVLQIGDINLSAQQLDDFIDVYPANQQVYMRDRKSVV